MVEWEENKDQVVVIIELSCDSNMCCCLLLILATQIRFLLKEVNGVAKPGRLLAIMGPSGSGKTTLLNVLAGQLAASPRLSLTGQIDVNGRPRAKMFKFVTAIWLLTVYMVLLSVNELLFFYNFHYFFYERVAYVRQEDLFFSQLTVREILSIAAELQLSHLVSAEKRMEYINSLLFRLGLVRISLVFIF